MFFFFKFLWLGVGDLWLNGHARQMGFRTDLKTAIQTSAQFHKTFWAANLQVGSNNYSGERLPPYSDPLMLGLVHNIVYYFVPSWHWEPIG